MFDFRNNSNRIVDNDLEVRYAVDEVTASSTTWYRVTRTASKTYRYVDMSFGGAGDTADQMKKLYTRTTVNVCGLQSGESVPQSISYPERRTAVQIFREHGSSYTVKIVVNETDVRASATRPASPASLFATENARDYDTADLT